MKGLEIKGLCISLGAWEMKNISVSAERGSFLSIVGPSGSGKTTLLRAIAGLEKPSSGKISINAEDCTHLPPEERDVGFVFQGNALFPHMTVFENTAFGPQMKKLPGISERVSGALSLVHLKGFKGRIPDTLSGGEKKRAAIARAIAFEPKILLLDEPFNGLDANLREKMKSLLNSLREKTGLTMVMVTHDIDDAFSLSDSIAVMNKGRIEQSGKTTDVLSKPKNGFVKNFFSGFCIARAEEEGKTGNFRFTGTITDASKRGAGKIDVSFRKGNYK